MTETSHHLLELNEVDRELSEQHDSSLRGLMRRRKQILECIDPTTASRYEILKNRFGMAMVRLVNGYCEACHMSVPSSQAQRLKLENEVLVCENCGRFLYFEND